MHTPVTSPLPVLVRGAVLAVLIALGAGFAPAAAHAADGDDVTWTVRTASNSFGADRTNFSYTINPGTEVQDALVVANRGDTPLDLGVYAADGYTTESGQFDLVVAGTDSVSIGAWVRSASDHVVVGPGQTVEVPFTLSVPENATPGDYAGGIVTSLAEEDAAEGISVDRRLGIRIALRVGGDLTPGLTIENAAIAWDGGLDPFAGGDATLTYTLHNTGNAVLSAQQSASAAGPFGLLPVEADAMEAPPQLLPGENWKVSVNLRDVAPVFLLTGTATVTPVVVDASGSKTPLAPVTATAVGSAVPWMLLLIIVLAVALVIVALRVRRVRQAQQRAREDARVQEAGEQALATKSLPTSGD
ncbi:hypothetical protein BH09ACT5_BH09ACT5_06200 [soil metagenome]